MGKLEGYVTQFDLYDFVDNLIKHCEKIAEDVNLFPQDIMAAWDGAIADEFNADFVGHYSLLHKCWSVAYANFETERFDCKDFKVTKSNLRRIIKRFERNVEDMVLKDRELKVKHVLGFIKVKAVAFSKKKKLLVLQPMENYFRATANEEYRLLVSNFNAKIEDMVEDKSIAKEEFYCGVDRLRKDKKSNDITYYCTTFSKPFIAEATEHICKETTKQIPNIKHHKIKAGITDKTFKKGYTTVQVIGEFTKEEFDKYKGIVKSFMDEVFGEDMISVKIFFKR